MDLLSVSGLLLGAIALVAVFSLVLIGSSGYDKYGKVPRDYFRRQFARFRTQTTICIVALVFSLVLLCGGIYLYLS